MLYTFFLLVSFTTDIIKTCSIMISIYCCLLLLPFLTWLYVNAYSHRERERERWGRERGGEEKEGGREREGEKQI